MAMMRSALARVFRRSASGSCSAPAGVCRRRPEIIDQAPPLPSLRPAAMPQMSVAAAAAAAAPTRRLLQGPRQFLVISEATEGVKWAGQKRFFSMERNANGFKLMESARLAVKKIKALGNARIEIDPRNEFYVVAVATAISLWLMSRQYRSLGDPTFSGGSMKKLMSDVDGTLDGG
ncbi:uncharacterized protein LOC127780584 [Oryza glaberrima]|uniref:Uncharacterized protein n=1 Tax=Oryza barthii TaxID=65489 RepID=A0A0D3GLP1_9ORYZ|nr:uncharacterized protein LOC127780584 [Oryza glaberrima]